jgi:predicted hydrocarbon binding protein
LGTNEFYKMDEGEGVMINSRVGHRAFVLGLEPWTHLIQEFYQTFGTGAVAILFEIGKTYGLSSAEEEKKSEIDRQLTMNMLGRAAVTAGWGKATISRDSPEDFTVKLQKCIFCAGMDNSQERNVPCFFVRGVISGFTEALFGSNRVEEVHCGSDFCEFNVKLVR